MSDKRCRLAVLGSGAGTNFEALARAGGADYEIVVVAGDHPDAPVLERARRHGIQTFSVSRNDYPQRDAHDAALAAALSSFRPDLVALAGYMRILGPVMLADWEGRMLNIHPSLLPAFPGLNTHARALAAGTTTHGATVHFVIRDLDAGPRIVQGRLRIESGTTAVELIKRVQALEHRIYPLAVGWWAAGRVGLRNGTAWFDGRPLAEPAIFEEDKCA